MIPVMVSLIRITISGEINTPYLSCFKVLTKSCSLGSELNRQHPNMDGKCILRGIGYRSFHSTRDDAMQVRLT